MLIVLSLIPYRLERLKFQCRNYCRWKINFPALIRRCQFLKAPLLILRGALPLCFIKQTPMRLSVLRYCCKCNRPLTPWGVNIEQGQTGLSRRRHAHFCLSPSSIVFLPIDLSLSALRPLHLFIIFPQFLVTFISKTLCLSYRRKHRFIIFCF